MHLSFTPPRQVKIGDAAAFAGTTPRAIRHYHQIGLLQEPARGADGRRRYGYDDMIRLLWIRRMAEAGIGLDDVRAAFDDTQDIDENLRRLEETLAARETDIERRRAAVQRLRAVGSPLGLLSDLVADRLDHLPPGAVRPSDLDALMVTERIFGPLAAAIQASTVIVPATHPGLRAEDDRLEAAEASLDDGVEPDDPRVEALAAQRYAYCKALERAIVAAGLDTAEEELLEGAGDMDGEHDGQMTAFEAFTKMPYDFSRSAALHRALGTTPRAGRSGQLTPGGRATKTRRGRDRLEPGIAGLGNAPEGHRGVVAGDVGLSGFDRVDKHMLMPQSGRHGGGVVERRAAECAGRRSALIGPDGLRLFRPGRQPHFNRLPRMVEELCSFSVDRS